jgi:hypothetical protein
MLSSWKCLVIINVDFDGGSIGLCVRFHAELTPTRCLATHHFRIG